MLERCCEPHHDGGIVRHDGLRGVRQRAAERRVARHGAHDGVEVGPAHGVVVPPRGAQAVRVDGGAAGGGRGGPRGGRRAARGASGRAAGGGRPRGWVSCALAGEPRAVADLHPRAKVALVLELHLCVVQTLSIESKGKAKECWHGNSIPSHLSHYMTQTPSSSKVVRRHPRGVMLMMQSPPVAVSDHESNLERSIISRSS